MYDAIIVGARVREPRQRCCSPGKAIESCWWTRRHFRVTPSPRTSCGPTAPRSWTAGAFWKAAATGSPPVAWNMIIDVGPFALKGGVTNTNAGRGGFCPQRTVLDKILVDAAVKSGAELREGFTVDDLTWDGDRVVASPAAPGNMDRSPSARVSSSGQTVCIRAWRAPSARPTTMPFRRWRRSTQLLRADSTPMISSSTFGTTAGAALSLLTTA